MTLHTLLCSSKFLIYLAEEGRYGIWIYITSVINANVEKLLFSNGVTINSMGGIRFEDDNFNEGLLYNEKC